MDEPPRICSCAALRQATRHVTRIYDAALAPVGLGLNQYAVFAKLDRHGPQSLQALADRLVMDRSSLGHLLRPLQSRGLLAINVSPSDRRQRLIELTSAGIAVFKQARPLWAEAERRFSAAFGADETAGLQTALKRVVDIELWP